MLRHYTGERRTLPWPRSATGLWRPEVPRGNRRRPGTATYLTGCVYCASFREASASPPGLGGCGGESRGQPAGTAQGPPRASPPRRVRGDAGGRCSATPLPTHRGGAGALPGRFTRRRHPRSPEGRRAAGRGQGRQRRTGPSPAPGQRRRERAGAAALHPPPVRGRSLIAAARGPGGFYSRRRALRGAEPPPPPAHLPAPSAERPCAKAPPCKHGARACPKWPGEGKRAWGGI